MRGPPDPKCERAPLAGRPVSQSQFPYIEESTETVREFQARCLRQRFALGYYFAATVAHLAFAVSR
jgi:hypothetical protein